jgi:hypothetical protein
MKKWQITGFLAILIIGFLLICGCTATSQPAPVADPISAQKTVLFSDDLSQWRSEWSEVYENANGKVFYSADSLHILSNKPPGKTVYHELHKNFDNFILDVDTKSVSGAVKNFQGVEIRGEDEDHYYDLSISADGFYSIHRFLGDDGQTLIGSDRAYSSYINTGIGVTNHIHVEANDNRLSLSVNGHKLSTVTDNALKEGTISLSASCAESNIFSEVVFNNLVITTI